MSAMIVLIGFSIVVALGFLIAFLVSVKKGQYDDTYTPSIRILFDDKKKKKEVSVNEKTKKPSM